MISYKGCLLDDATCFPARLIILVSLYTANPSCQDYSILAFVGLAVAENLDGTAWSEPKTLDLLLWIRFSWIVTPTITLLDRGVLVKRDTSLGLAAPCC